MTVGALTGVKVLDLSRWIAGPHAALMLGDMGADVVKVESGSGDPSRLSPPQLEAESSYFLALNRSKRGLALNLRSQGGMIVLKRLIAEADVLIENFRPGTMSKMGLEIDELLAEHPGLIVVSISGYGQDGPRSQQGAFDSIAQAASGLHAMTGQAEGPPVKAGFYVADYSAALHATIGVLAALRARDETRLGQHVDIALVESILSMSATLVPGYVGAGVEPTRVGNGSIHNAPVGVYECTNGYVQLSASTDALFEQLCSAMHIAYLLEDARFASNAGRMEHSEALDRILAEWTSTRTTSEVAAVLDSAGVPASPIKGIAEIMQDEQLNARKYFVKQQHPVAGSVTLAGTPIRFSRTPSDTTRPAPTLGQHSEEVLQDWIGLSPDEAVALLASEK